ADACLAVDVGNSLIKVAACRSAGPSELPEVVKRWQWPSAEVPPEEFARSVPAEHKVWYVASVCGPAAGRLQAWVAAHRAADRVVRLTVDSLPLKVNVDEPAAVGMDRLAAAVGANLLRPDDRAAVIVDAGTAITVDSVDRQGTFLGGFILPGPQLAAAALAANTDQLPEINVSGELPDEGLGKNTREAMRRGILWGLGGAVEHLVQRSERYLGCPTSVFLAGGALAALLAERLPHATRAADLVLRGIAYSGWWVEQSEG